MTAAISDNLSATHVDDSDTTSLSVGPPKTIMIAERGGARRRPMRAKK